MAYFRYTEAEERAIEANMVNDEEAFTLLDLIDAEFRSDPTSTQCFDARVVERVKICVARHKEFVRKHLPFVS